MNRRLGAALCLAWMRLTPFCIVQVTLLETFLTRRIVVLRSQSRGCASGRPHRAVVNIEICFGTFYYMAEFITWAKVACPRHIGFVVDFSKGIAQIMIAVAPSPTFKTDLYSSSKTAKECRYVLETTLQILICATPTTLDHPRFLRHGYRCGVGNVDDPPRPVY